ncbi:MAG: hypothetical protein II939_13070, partial [Bacteroidales bacterium]|nr:hypothetical protein [Bacteroidales bacterium]
MKKSLLSVFLIVAAAFIVSCKESDDDPTPDANQSQSDSPSEVQIVGSELTDDVAEYIFQKKSSKRGIGFNHITPAMAL